MISPRDIVIRSDNGPNVNSVARKKLVGRRTEGPRIGPLLSERGVCSYFNQFLKVLTKK